MNAIGPVEPGEDTYGRANTHGRKAAAPRAAWRAPRRHHRTTLAAAAAVLLGAAGLILHLTRPEPPPAPPPPWPSQSVAVTYTGEMSRPRAGERNFTFAVTVTHEAGPPVSVRRAAQPSAALSVRVSPATPFTVKSGTPRKLIITMHIRECGEVPRNAGLPFLEVTLRNARANERQSYILGPEYANDLSGALTAACPRTRVS
ncbi:Tat pathway signal sequence domain protein [Streptomyces sp. KN37]|uniref:Tat pathway signal sequence domain protein n=1 Tax=Streptomyces sp. KN37 TaxID=3090667 RepID=UPI002A762C67|nr:Tat pathway signal sequence domain protein [Streptomyces sp. KN37]WPO74429.1 Tat pathway signal sequence domain protein [Streptomyces sp. KN37]